MKKEMKAWRKFIVNEQDGDPTGDPTVGQFMATFSKQSPRTASKIFGQLARFAVSAAVGAGAGALAGAATGGVGAGLGVAAAGATNAALSKLFERVAEKSGDLAKFMIAMSENQVDDNNRTGLALYYDLDDEYEALLQGMDSKLANKFQEELFKYFKKSFNEMKEAKPDEPLKDYIEFTANDYLKQFLEDTSMSSVGVRVNSSRKAE